MCEIIGLYTYASNIVIDSLYAIKVIKIILLKMLPVQVQCKVLVSWEKKMKRCITLFVLCLLTACTGDNGSIDYDYQHRSHNPLGAPTNPEQDFSNAITNYNATVTGLLSNTENQISDYIQYRLNEWSLFNPDTGVDVSRVDIASAASWLTGDEYTETEIKDKFVDNFLLMHMAAYVVDNRLNSCFNNATVDSAAACFVRWRDRNTTTFNEISKEIRKYTLLLNAENAKFNTQYGGEIQFILDDDGRITGAKIVQDGKTVKFDNWVYTDINDDATRMYFNSIGKNLGLSYSDFGTYSVVKNRPDAASDIRDILSDNAVFAGGYLSHKIGTEDIAGDVNFTGRAVGTASNAQHVVDLDGNATLVFNRSTGNSTLSAQFNNWYDVNVNDNGEIEFNNYSNKNNLVKLEKKSDVNGVIKDDGAKFDATYYGEKPDTGIPNEATGLVRYNEAESGVDMNIAFGVK